ncbi:MAG: hypothetical protein GC165_07185 [Armatimonadetes bacterium]|nr:hypothetical protein [Armatimonadota bacterium]
MPSNSSWSREIRAVFMKEWHAETRGLSGFTTTGLICLVSVITANAITWTTSLNPMIAAGIYWMILVFAASVSLARTFLGEEENHTADFWRLCARPEAVYWGKALFNIIQMIVATLLMSVAFVIILKVRIANPGVFATTALGGAIAIASTVTLSGAIAAPANNRYPLAAAISVPVLLFLINLGVSGTATAFGEPLENGEKAGIVMIAYAIATCTVGPVVYSKIWKG